MSSLPRRPLAPDCARGWSRSARNLLLWSVFFPSFSLRHFSFRSEVAFFSAEVATSADVFLFAPSGLLPPFSAFRRLCQADETAFCRKSLFVRRPSKATRSMPAWLGSQAPSLFASGGFLISTLFFKTAAAFLFSPTRRFLYCTGRSPPPPPPRGPFRPHFLFSSLSHTIKPLAFGERVSCS